MQYQNPFVEADSKPCIIVIKSQGCSSGAINFFNYSLCIKLGSFAFVIICNCNNVHVAIHLGNPVCIFRSGNSLTLETWHDLVIERRAQNINLIIDNKLENSSQTAGSYVELNTNDEIYIGKKL